MRTTTMLLMAGASLLLATPQAEAKGHTCDKKCTKALTEPTPYRAFENKQVKWYGYNDPPAKVVIAVRKPTDTVLLNRPAIVLLVSDYDGKSCIAAHYERVVFTNRRVVKLAKDLTPVRLERNILGALPKVAKQLKYDGKPAILIVGIRQEVIAKFTKKVGAKTVARALRKALKSQRTIRRATKSMGQNLEAARGALAKSDYREAAKRLTRVLRGKGSDAIKLQAEELMVKLEAAGKATLKALTKAKKGAVEEYLALQTLQEDFRPVRRIRALIDHRIEVLEEGAESWRLIQEYQGKQQLKQAVALAKAGKKKQARAILKEVEQEYIGLTCAAKARRLLTRIRE